MPTDTTDPALPVLFVSGWASDHRMLAPQLAHFTEHPAYDAVHCAWLPWEKGDTLATYGQRLAATHDPGGPCAVVGVSMGGMLAQEMAAHLDTRALVVIASSRGRAGYPWLSRVLSGLLRVTPWPVAWLAHRAATRFARLAGRIGWFEPLHEMEDWRTVDLLRAARAVLRWRGPTHGRLTPMTQVHGRKDRVLRCPAPAPETADHRVVVLDAGGHLLNMAHPDAVNAAIEAALEPVTR